MKKILISAVVAATMFAPVKETLAWGDNGHRIVAKIGELYLTPSAKAAVEKILGSESMPMAATWCDFVRSDAKYKYMNTWHYTSIPDAGGYDAKDPKGYIIQNIDRIISELKDPTLEPEKQKFNIRVLIHLVGDIHQPLHVGRENDFGGNSVKVKWFEEETNLHTVWDSKMLEHQGLSYTEYVDFINRPTEEEKKEYLSNTSVMKWAIESWQLRESIYQIGNGDLGYQYSHDHIEQVEKRLLQGGMHLAAVLNEIFK